METFYKETILFWSVPVNEVSKVVVEFRVVSGGKVSPAEGGVLGLRPHEGKVKAEDVSRNVGLLGIRTKDTKPTALGKLPTLIVQVLYSNRDISACAFYFSRASS